MTRWRSSLCPLLIAVFIAALLASCDDPRRTLVPIPAANTAGLEPSVLAAIAKAQAQLDRVKAEKPSDSELGDAYGELAMTYHAHSLVPSAEAAYANARALAPRDRRWPYLLGHLYNDAGRLPEAIPVFEAAYALDPDDAPTLL